VTDEIDGILRLLASTCRGPINIGNPAEFTMLELASLVLEITGSDSNLVFEQLPEDDPTQRQPDISIAKEVLGWEPRVALENGLQLTVEWFRGLKN
jgi:nucleoside-diphosphate-sugar epimerase